MLSASALNQINGQRIPVWNDNKFIINAQPRHHDHDLFVSYLQFTSQHRSQAQQSQKEFFSVSNEYSLSAMLRCADLSTTVWRVTNELRKDAQSQVTEDIQAQSVTVMSHHSPSIQMNFDLLINVADTVFLVAMSVSNWCCLLWAFCRWSVPVWSLDVGLSSAQHTHQISSGQPVATETLSHHNAHTFFAITKNPEIKSLGFAERIKRMEMNYLQQGKYQWSIPAVSPTPSSLDLVCRLVFPSHNLPQTPALLVKTPPEGPEAPPFWVPLH